MRLLKTFGLAIAMAVQCYTQTMRWIQPGAPNSASAASAEWLVTGTPTGPIQLWDIRGEKPLFIRSMFGHNLGTFELSISDDGKTALSTSDDMNCRLWNLTEGTSRVFGASRRFHFFQLHPKGTRVAQFDPGDNVRIYEAPSGATLAYLSLDGYNVFAFGVHENEYAVGFGDTVQIHSLTNAPIREYIVPTSARSEVHTIAFSPDGSLIAASAGVYSPIQTNVIAIWSVATRENVALLSGSSAYGLKFSPDGSMLAARPAHDQVVFWDPQNRQPVGALSNVPSSTTFIGTNGFLVDNDIVRIPTGGRAQLTPATGQPLALEFSPDGSMLASPRAIWNTANGELLTTLKPTGNSAQAYSSTYNPLNRGPIPISFTGSNSILVLNKVFDLGDGREISEVPYGAAVEAGAGGYFVRGATSNIIAELRGYSDGSLLRQFQFTNRMGAWSMGLSPSQNLLATAFTQDSSLDKTVRIWNARTGAFLRAMTNYVGLPYKFTFSKDEKLLAAASEQFGPELIVWDVATGRPVFLPNYGGGQAMAFDFLHDSHFLVWGYDGIHIADLQTGALITTITNEAFQVITVAVSPDRSKIALGRRDGTVLMIDTPTLDSLTIQNTDALPTVTFFAQGGTSYALESSDDLKNWTMVTNYVGVGARIQRSFRPAAQIFHRLSKRPPPPLILNDF